LTNKDKYIAFCETRDDIPIFSEPWWLDAVCVDGSWDVCIVEKNGIIQATLPYYQTKLKGLSVIRMPLLTPYLGVQFFSNKHISSAKNSQSAIKNTEQLVEQLPKVAFLQQVHSPEFLNWLPFYWMGFNQTTMYTYHLDIKDTDVVYKGFRQNLKRNLKSAQSDLICKESEDLDLFYKINKTTFDRQGLSIPYSFDFLRNLDTILKEKEKRKIFISYDKNGNALASGYYAWDNQKAYYLAGGHSGNREAMSWTMWQAIQYFSTKVQVFDFEGSMIKNIAHYFSGYGASLIPYHHITKGKNKMINILKILKS